VVFERGVWAFLALGSWVYHLTIGMGAFIALGTALGRDRDRSTLEHCRCNFLYSIFALPPYHDMTRGLFRCRRHRCIAPVSDSLVLCLRFRCLLPVRVVYTYLNKTRALRLFITGSPQVTDPGAHFHFPSVSRSANFPSGQYHHYNNLLLSTLPLTPYAANASESK